MGGTSQRSWPAWGLCAVALVASLCLLPGASAVTSRLWGNNGEKFDPSGMARLLDWSYSGYKCNEEPLPDEKPVASVKDYGAVGDGSTDDTAAFVQAVEEAPEGVLLVPAGRYMLTGFVNITRRLVLRGEGSGRTTLFFPKPLAQLYGDVGINSASQWSFTTGFVNFIGQDFFNDGTMISRVTAFSQRGTKEVKVASLGGVQAGDWVGLTVGDDNGLLWTDVNHGLYRGCIDSRCTNAKRPYSFVSRVDEVRASDRTLVLERFLPFNVSVALKGELHRWSPVLEEVGMEGISFEFASGRYLGHFKEQGWNGLMMQDVANCWIRDVHVVNADLSFILNGLQFCTVANVKATGTSVRGTLMGHHGIFSNSGTADTLVTGFEISGTFVHDTSVDFYSRFVVWRNGTGTDLNMDHHTAQTYGILWTNLDTGKGMRPLLSGGTRSRGLDAGSLTTFWNVGQAAGAVMRLGPRSDFGPWINFIGFDVTMIPLTASVYTRTWFYENIPAASLTPPDLFMAQLERRLGADGLANIPAYRAPSNPVPATATPPARRSPSPPTVRTSPPPSVRSPPPPPVAMPPPPISKPPPVRRAPPPGSPPEPDYPPEPDTPPPPPPPPDAPAAPPPPSPKPKGGKKPPPPPPKSPPSPKPKGGKKPPPPPPKRAG